MISDSVIKYLTDDDRIMCALLFLFFLPEMIMFYELPLISYWIPVVSTISRFMLPALVPDHIDNTFCNYLFMAFISSIGYGVLFFAGIGNFWFYIVPYTLLFTILVLHATGVTPKINNRATVNIHHKNILWEECIEIESEKK